MLRSLLSIGAMSAILATALVFPTQTEARRCPDEVPETLLSLYAASEVIAIGTFDGTSEVSVERQEENYSVVKTRSDYTISSVLKGPVTKAIAIDDSEYRFVPDEAEEEVEHAEVEPAEDEEFVVKPGDTVMLFLKNSRSEESPGLYPIGYRQGIKKLSGDTLRAYEARVKELNAIFGVETGREQAIAQWLVSVTEDPLTRWEGAFELTLAFQEAEWADEEAKRMAEAGEAAEGSEEPVGDENSEEAAEDGEDAVEEFDMYRFRLDYVRSITDAQKQILLNTFIYSIRYSDIGELSVKPSSGDQALMELVRRWGDLRFTDVLIDQLRAGAGDVYYKYQLMEAVAQTLEAEELSAIASEFAERMYEEDSTVIEEEKVPVSDDAAAGEGENAGAGAFVAVVEQTTEAVERPVSETAEAKETKTYGQLRAELLEKFLAAADRRLATRE